MMIVNENKFFELINKIKNKPFEFSSGWFNYQKAKGNDLICFVDSDKNTQIACFGRIKRIRFIGEIIDLCGPVYSKDVSSKQLNKFLSLILKERFFGYLFNINTLYDVDFEIAARKSGLKRPIGQFNTSLSIWVDVNNVDGNTQWKRNLKKSLQVDFEFKNIMNPTIQEAELIEVLFSENAKTKGLAYSLKSNQIIKLLHDEKILLFFLYKNKAPIAARIVSIDDEIAYDVYACNSNEARKDGATQYLMNSIFDFLKDRGVKYFDFSRIPVGKKGAEGVYDFKKATRGDVVQYNGEWVFFKKKILRHFYYFYNVLVSKRDFY